MWQAEPPPRPRDAFTAGWDDCNIGNVFLWPDHVSREVWLSLYSPCSPPLLRLRKTGASGARLLPGLQWRLARQTWYIPTCAWTRFTAGCAWELGWAAAWLQCRVLLASANVSQRMTVVPWAVRRTNGTRMSTVSPEIHVVTTSFCVSCDKTKLLWREVATVIPNSYFYSWTSLEMPKQTRGPIWGHWCIP